MDKAHATPLDHIYQLSANFTAYITWQEIFDWFYLKVSTT